MVLCVIPCDAFWPSHYAQYHHSSSSVNINQTTPPFSSIITIIYQMAHVIDSDSNVSADHWPVSSPPLSNSGYSLQEPVSIRMYLQTPPHLVLLPAPSNVDSKYLKSSSKFLLRQFFIQNMFLLQISKLMHPKNPLLTAVSFMSIRSNISKKSITN